MRTVMVNLGQCLPGKPNRFVVLGTSNTSKILH